MITAVSNVKGYDWGTWLMGIVRACISGGAGAVVAAFGSMGIDPEHFNLSKGYHHTLELMGIMFGFMALVHMMMFLQTHPAPEPITEQSKGGQNDTTKNSVVNNTATVHDAGGVQQKTGGTTPGNV
jgi:hypothetical protein